MLTRKSGLLGTYIKKFGKMNKRSANIINILMWAMLALLALFLIRLFSVRWFCKIEFEHDLPPLDLISLLVTSLVTIFLGYYITKKLTESRIEKDSLIEDLKKIESYMYSVQDVLKNYKKVDVQQITTELEMAVLNISRFKNTLMIVGEKDIKTESLENCFFQLYTISTNFDGETAQVDDLASGKILQKSDQVLLEVRRLMHVINTQ